MPGRPFLMVRRLPATPTGPSFRLRSPQTPIWREETSGELVGANVGYEARQKARCPARAAGGTSRIAQRRSSFRSSLSGSVRGSVRDRFRRTVLEFLTRRIHVSNKRAISTALGLTGTPRLGVFLPAFDQRLKRRRSPPVRAWGQSPLSTCPTALLGRPAAGSCRARRLGGNQTGARCVSAVLPTHVVEVQPTRCARSLDGPRSRRGHRHAGHTATGPHHGGFVTTS